MKKIKIIIAMHKPYPVPKDELYLPLWVGAAKKETFDSDAEDEIQRDDTGENISAKNPNYCELTGLYWGWKNLEADVIGLVHYRRHFVGNHKGTDKMQRVLSGDEAQELMEKYDIVVPTKRKYYIESLYSHYKNTLDGKHLDMTREIIAQKYPEYLPACVHAYTNTWGYMFNMCLMNKEYLDKYCTWLFSVLGELEQRMKENGELEKLSPFEARLFGRVSEILFNVWLRREQECNPKLRVKEQPTIHLETVNWWKKGMAFLQAKFFGKKYGASF